MQQSTGIFRSKRKVVQIFAKTGADSRLAAEVVAVSAIELGWSMCLISFRGLTTVRVLQTARTWLLSCLAVKKKNWLTHSVRIVCRREWICYSTAPFILILDIRWWRVANLTPRQRYHSGLNLRHSMKVLVGNQILPGNFDNNKCNLPAREILSRYLIVPVQTTNQLRYSGF
jgi:hypothetical protein